MDAIAARSSLVTKRQRLAGPSKAVAQLADRTGLLAISPKYSTLPERPLSAAATEIRSL